MKNVLTALACVLSVSMTAQEQVITYPYNPDADTDSLIAVPDALEFLSLYGNEFIPEPITIDGVLISEWFEQNNNNEAPFLECVDMGLLPGCESFDLGQYASLLPTGYGYTYKINDSNPNLTNGLIDQPHWRKFQIHNLELDPSQLLFVKYRRFPGSHLFISAPFMPEFDENNNVFFYIVKSFSPDCYNNLDLPFIDHTMLLSEFGDDDTDYFEIYYLKGGSLSDLGILFRLEQ